MGTQKKFDMRWFLYIACLCVFGGGISAFAGTVYTTRFAAKKILTYTVGDNELILEEENDLSRWGVIGIAFDESPEGSFLFLTYEYEPLIQVLDSQDMGLIKEVRLPQAANLTGITYDSERNKVYVTDRFTNHLFSYSWNARKRTLEPDFEDPYYIELEEIVYEGTTIGAMGLALDPIADRLYVSDISDTIKYYNVDNWTYEGSVQTTLDTVIGIAVNPTDQSLYFGSMDAYGQEWHYLGRYDLTAADPNEAESHESIGASVCGIACDPETGYVYVTTHSDGDNGDESSVLMFCPYDPAEPEEFNLTLVWNSPEELLGLTGIVFTETEPKPSGLYLDKQDNIETCVYPEDMITYTIAVHPLYRTEPNVVVTDILPYEVKFDSADMNGTYDSDHHICVWELGDLLWIDPNISDPNTYLTLTVQVNEGAEPAGEIVNGVRAESDFSYNAAQEETAVCCWGGDVIYVDKDARWNWTSFGGLTGGRGYNNGTSWENAYRDPNDALARAKKDCGSEIWVAEGTYYPGGDPENSFFEIPDGVGVYGGFAGIETERDQRNWKQHKTILRGYIRPDRYGNPIHNETVVKMKDETVLDGFTVTEASDYGIYGDGADFTVENCQVVDNQQYGIRAQDGDVAIKWCSIKNNGFNGVYHTGTTKTILIENCILSNNKRYGFQSENSTPIIKNSIIAKNGNQGTGFYGVFIFWPENNPVLYNNTIVYNQRYGIAFADNSNETDWPDIQNCILYYNNGDEAQIAGLTLKQIYYCCVPDCNDINSQHNIDDEPAFAYSDPNNLHLAWNSPCKNMGNPSHDNDDVGLYDMDSEDRIVDSRVDIGADEIYSCDENLSEDDIWHPLDWDSDGIINYIQFGDFSRAWLSCEPNFPGDPNNWNPVCNLDKTGDSEHRIDLADLAEFCEEKEIKPDTWLWVACWKRSQMNHPETMFYSIMSGGESIISMQMAESDETSSIMDTDTSPVEEKSIEQQILDLEEIIEFLEKIWMEEPDIQEVIDPEVWEDFMEAVNQSLIELQTEEIQIE